MKLLKITFAVLLLGSAFQVGRDCGEKRGWFADETPAKPPTEDLNVTFEPEGPSKEDLRRELAGLSYSEAMRVNRPAEAKDLGRRLHYATYGIVDADPWRALELARKATQVAEISDRHNWARWNSVIGERMAELFRAGRLATLLDWRYAIGGLADGLLEAGGGEQAIFEMAAEHPGAGYWQPETWGTKSPMKR